MLEKGDSGVWSSPDTPPDYYDVWIIPDGTPGTIPTKTSDLTNDSGYITSASVPTKVSQLQNDSGYITSASLPTKVSDLQNDTGFITNSVSNLTNYTTTTSLTSLLNNKQNSVLSGTSSPLSSLGVNGDIYLQYEEEE